MFIFLGIFILYIKNGGDNVKREWLSQIRKSKSMTQEQVAKLAYIDRAFYSQIENRKRNPSFNVAENIARVLGFSPLIFYKENIDNESNNSVYNIPQKYRAIDSGGILYVYNSSEMYLQRCMEFLISGIEQNSYCLIIDNLNNNLQIRKNIKDTLNNNDLLESNYIQFINKEEVTINKSYDIINHRLEELQWYFGNEKTIRVWIHNGNTRENNMKNQLDTSSLYNNKNIFVQSFEATTITAEMYIKFMRIYPYLMTDYEIVDSPLYITNNNSNILPSFFIQENN